MKIYPNPSKTTSYISVPRELALECNMTITNMQGELIIQQSFKEIHNSFIPVDLSKYPNGVYKITLGNEYFVESEDLLALS